MASKKNKQKTFKKPSVVKTTATKTEVFDAEKKLTSIEILQNVTNVLKDSESIGYIVGVAGYDGKILPYVSAASVGDLLTIKYVIEKEISRLLDKTYTTNEAKANAVAQQ